MTARTDTAIAKARAQIVRIQGALADMEYLASGTLLKRMKRCGKPQCACARDPAARHGPYYEWNYMKGGKLHHTSLSPEQAKRMRRAIANYRKAKRLLRLWEAQTQRLIELNAPEPR